VTSVPLSQAGVALMPWTAPPRKPGPTELTGDGRRIALEHLAGDCDGQPYGVVMTLLATWAHHSLSPRRRADLFAWYCDSLMRCTALREGVADWDGEMPGMCDGDRLEMAVETLGDRAREAMFALVTGEVDRP
jgi:hypothetical protein